jgi:hypothetical protein
MTSHNYPTIYPQFPQSKHLFVFYKSSLAYKDNNIDVVVIDVLCHWCRLGGGVKNHYFGVGAFSM